MFVLWGDHVDILHMQVGDGALQGDRPLGRPWLATRGAQRVVQAHKLRCEILGLEFSMFRKNANINTIKKCKKPQTHDIAGKNLNHQVANHAPLLFHIPGRTDGGLKVEKLVTKF